MAESDRKVWWPEEYDHAAQGGTVDIKRPDLQDGQMGLARWKASKGAQIIKKQLLATSQKRSEGDKKWVEMSLRKVSGLPTCNCGFKKGFGKC